jgi:uncharacterized protein (TIGR00661 family)
MAKLFFSLSGEGRGHATRVRAVVEELRSLHRITILAPGNALEFLEPLYANTDVRVIPIPGMMFHYDKARRLDLWRTAGGGARYLCGFGHLRAELEMLLDRERPDLVVADFEPALPRSARRRGIPFVSLTHQHFLLAYDLSSLPWSLRAHAVYMSWVVGAYYSGQRHNIVSSFYFPPLRRHSREVTQVGVMLRPEVRAAVPSAGGHVVAYLRRFAGPNVLEALAGVGRPVRVYGLGERPSAGRVTFHAINEKRFVADLASCFALVATAGNQLVGEALYLGKPCFVMPEARNYEQFMNAHFLAQTGGGAWMGMERVTPAALREFAHRRDEFAARIDRSRLDGLPAALRTLERFLPGASRPNRRSAAAPHPAMVPELTA